MHCTVHTQGDDEIGVRARLLWPKFPSPARIDGISYAALCFSLMSFYLRLVNWANSAAASTDSIHTSIPVQDVFAAAAAAATPPTYLPTSTVTKRRKINCNFSYYDK